MNEPIEIKANEQRNKAPKSHTLKIVNGQVVCVSCNFMHTVKYPKALVEEKGTLVIESN